ncbi:hypothetical protein L1987_14139 [Smallanthus sonchifolius]|uniref:Uncharacterized protein n=1 Tax=Smallanthus sonchifolius TaxID=185202 RepID=A0ACB9J2G6_9ASTR|nr:hypothetical protein L1987_14139 [Smallanthus sonchifolius]
MELEDATEGFSEGNFLAEGGFGSVHRGALKDGRMVAVIASSQGDSEFYSEADVLSCAQHRNVVMLIGFCVEDGRRLLVYEYMVLWILTFMGVITGYCNGLRDRRSRLELLEG